MAQPPSAPGARSALVLTASDRSAAGTRQDASGGLLAARLTALGFTVERRVVPDAEAAMKGPQIRYRVKIGDGPGRSRAVGCDFSYDYVKINADYTN